MNEAEILRRFAEFDIEKIAEPTTVLRLSREWFRRTLQSQGVDIPNNAEIKIAAPSGNETSVFVRFKRQEVQEINIRNFIGVDTSRFNKDLVKTIKGEGLKVPIRVRKLGNGKYKIIDGVCRYLACKELGYETIPSIVVH